VATGGTSLLRTYFSSQCSALSIHRFQSGTTYRNLIDAKARPTEINIPAMRINEAGLTGAG